jgi:DNA replication protein DnaC
MLDHPTLDLLHELGLHGMAQGVRQLAQNPEAGNLEHGEWLAILLEHEATLRRQKRFEARARTARLRHAASVEDIDYHARRGLDRALFLKLAAGDWIRQHRNLLVTGPTGIGKSCIACALGNQAARTGFSVRYQRLPRLLDELALARVDGNAARVFVRLARIQLLILDDWAMAKLTAEQRRDLMEVIDDRHQRASTILATQVPIERWHDMIGDPTPASAGAGSMPTPSSTG